MNHPHSATVSPFLTKQVKSSTTTLESFTESLCASIYFPIVFVLSFVRLFPCHPVALAREDYSAVATAVALQHSASVVLVHHHHVASEQLLSRHGTGLIVGFIMG